MTDEDTGSHALDTLAVAVNLAGSEVDHAPDGHVAFTLATKYADAFHQATERVTRLRGRAAARIRDEEALTLRALADRIGVSKSRADQLVKEADHE